VVPFFQKRGTTRRRQGERQRPMIKAIAQEVAKPGALRVFALTPTRVVRVRSPDDARTSSLLSPSALAEHFLPKNAPSSVLPGYLTYAKYAMASSALGTAASVVSIQAMLVAIGVASSSTMPMAATLNWIIKVGVRAPLHRWDSPHPPRAQGRSGPIGRRGVCQHGQHAV